MPWLRNMDIQAGTQCGICESIVICPFKDLVDDNKIVFLFAVDVSYLTGEEQETVYKVIDAMGVKLRSKMAEELQKHSGELTEDLVENTIDSLIARKASEDDGVRLKLSDSIRQKYFVGMSAVQMAEVVERVLEAWFSGKEAAYVQQRRPEVLGSFVFLRDNYGCL